jgi:hypothetical protein
MTTNRYAEYTREQLELELFVATQEYVKLRRSLEKCEAELSLYARHEPDLYVIKNPFDGPSFELE